MTVLGELEPFFKFSRIFGYSPHSVSAGEVDVGLSRVGVFYSGLCVVLYSSLVYGRFANTLDTVEDKKLLYLTIFRNLLIVFVIAIDIILCVINHRKLRASVSNMQRYDRAVESKARFAAPRAKTQFLRCSIGFTTVVVYYLCIAWMSYYCTEESDGLEDSIVYFVFYTCMTSSILKFAAIAVSLRRRFRHLNATVKATGSAPYWSRDQRLIAGGGWCRRQLNPRDACRLHGYLLAAARQLNSFYSAQLSLWIALCTFNLMSRLYVFSEPIEMLNLVRIFREAGMAIASALLISICTVVCHTTAQEANKVGSVSFSSDSRIFRSREGLHDFTDHSEIQDNVQSGLYFLFHRLDFVAAFGLVKVELPLLRAIAGAITTYLVILKSSK